MMLPVVCTAILERYLVPQQLVLAGRNFSENKLEGSVDRASQLMQFIVAKFAIHGR